ncbi:hypothetical protein TNCT_600081 [Trichonephila clavata]|uniref:Uncharacterized protein n=1 Tax=Trichonephila clavata TaxID=2740835 RepID=A0A8X6FY52_TRICU|nr:hypothetical protein TNCT_600081 [Trichonephila clavata]
MRKQNYSKSTSYDTDRTVPDGRSTAAQRMGTPQTHTQAVNESFFCLYSPEICHESQEAAEKWRSPVASIRVAAHLGVKVDPVKSKAAYANHDDENLPCIAEACLHC